MKRQMKHGMLAMGLVAALLLVATVSAEIVDYGGTTLSFYNITNNNPVNGQIGQDQLYVDVVNCAAWDGVGTRPAGLCEVGGDFDPSLVLFYFRNMGPEPCSISEIYFDDGTLLGLVSVWDEAVASDGDKCGVSFTQDAIDPVSPPNLPGGNTISPPFVVTAQFKADADSPEGHCGVDPGQWVAIAFSLQSGGAYADVIDDLTDGALRIGIHVKGFELGDAGNEDEGDGSESFVNMPPGEEPPTAVTLASFSADAGLGSATVAWETGTEIDNAGFNLYRAAGPDGPFVKVNDGLIAAKGDAVGGASYSYLDAGLSAGTYYYLLEDLDLNGTTTRHGPVSAAVLPLVRRPLGRPGVSR